MTASACELDREVKLADGNWDAVQVINSIAEKIIEAGYDCEVGLRSGAMVPLFTAVQRNDVDIFMDVWPANNAEILEKTLDAGAVDLGVMYSDATEGWYVPRYVVEGDSSRGIEAMAPGLKSVKDLPEYKDLFAPSENASKGRFYNCPIGWGCEQTNNVKLKEYGLLDSFDNFNPGSGSGLALAFASAYKKGEPIVGYYWEPTWLMGVYDLVKLQEPECDDSNANACAFPAAEAHIIASGKFADEADGLETFFRKVSMKTKEISQMLAFIRENEEAERDEAALNFLKTQEETWTQWVPEDVAAKVKAAL